MLVKSRQPLLMILWLVMLPMLMMSFGVPLIQFSFLLKLESSLVLIPAASHLPLNTKQKLLWIS